VTLHLESRVEYVQLSDYCEIAAELLGDAPRKIEALPGIDRVEAALASPQARFGEHDAYPTLIEKATVLIDHLAQSRPLPDANKRAALMTAWLFLERNGHPFKERTLDTDISMVGRIAAGETTIGEISLWLERRT